MSCLLCQSGEFQEVFRGSDRLYRTTTRQFPIVRCKSCGLMRMEPPPSAEELILYYPPHYWFRPVPSAAGWLEEQYRRLLIRDHLGFVERAWKHAGSRGPVLDVGCGGGLLPGMLRGRGVRGIGLDISPEAAGAAWHHNRVPALCGDFLHPPFADGSCSVVTMFHVLEHLPDPLGFLRTAGALLQPGGRLVIQVPNIDCWQWRLFQANWNGVDVPRHLWNFRTSDVVRLLKAAGFAAIRTKLFSWRDNPAGLATTLCPSLDPVARRVLGKQPNVSTDLLYLALVMAAIPFTLLEAAFGKGSTVMIEARKTE